MRAPCVRAVLDAASVSTQSHVAHVVRIAGIVEGVALQLLPNVTANVRRRDGAVNSTCPKRDDAGASRIVQGLVTSSRHPVRRRQVAA